MIPIANLIKIRNTNFFLILLLVSLSLFVYAVLLKLNGIPLLKRLDFSKIYDIRGEVNYGPAVMGYFVTWLANIINCFWIALAWHKRRYFGLIAAFLLQIILYLLTVNKGFLFTPMLLVLLLYFTQKNQLLKPFLSILIIIVLFSIALSESKISRWPASLFVRRTLFDPPQVSFNYYDFFSKNKLMYLSESKLGFGLVKNPYDKYNMSSANIMGMLYMDNPEQHMNTGYLGDAYMNFGILGILIFSFLLGLIFVIADWVSRKINISVAIGALMPAIHKFINGSLFSTMLTGGLLLGLFVVWLYHDEK